MGCWAGQVRLDPIHTLENEIPVDLAMFLDRKAYTPMLSRRQRPRLTERASADVLGPKPGLLLASPEQPPERRPQGRLLPLRRILALGGLFARRVANRGISDGTQDRVGSPPLWWRNRHSERGALPWRFGPVVRRSRCRARLRARDRGTGTGGRRWRRGGRRFQPGFPGQVRAAASGAGADRRRWSGGCGSLHFYLLLLVRGAATRAGFAMARLLVLLLSMLGLP